jgi:hypothetical protein
VYGYGGGVNLIIVLAHANGAIGHKAVDGGVAGLGGIQKREGG